MAEKTQRQLELEGLLARVAEAGPDRDLYLERLILDVFFTDDTRNWPNGLASLGYSMTCSLDGALKLVGLVLPGWRWLAHSPRSGLAWGASLSDPVQGGLIVTGEHKVSAELALLTAALKAHVALEKSGVVWSPPVKEARTATFTRSLDLATAQE